MGIFLTACSSIEGGASSIAIRTGFEESVPAKTADTGVQRGYVQTHIFPLQNLYYAPTALFVPLGIVQDMRDERAISLGVSRIIWQTFLTEQTFSTLEMADMNPPYKVENALGLAKAKGAEIMIGGYITYFLDGGPNGDSKIAIKLDAYHVDTGALLWSLSHSGTLAYETYEDFIFFERNKQMPTDPMSTLVYIVGSDLAKTIYPWTHGGKTLRPDS